MCVCATRAIYVNLISVGMLCCALVCVRAYVCSLLSSEWIQ
jgi:hypothetical protein